MTLYTQVKADQLTARKAKEALAATLLTTLIGEVSALAKNDGNREVTDADVVKVCKKFIDGMNDTIKFLGDSNPEGTATAQAEKAILEKYMPKQMSEDELKIAVGIIIDTVGKDMGKIMGKLKVGFGGQYDGALASKIVKAALA